MYKYVLIPILLLFVGCVSIAMAAPSTAYVMFINENPGVTQLGLVKFTVDKAGNKTGYKLMNMRWADAVKIINLEPGVYGVTQYSPYYDKITEYQTFEVKDKLITVKFRELF